MIPDKELNALLDRIERSNSLGVSSTYARLLRFLVESTQAGSIPKEQIIAEHLLGKNFAKSDSSKIRVYIYHLRKKLDQYYENEGKEEQYVLSIPKGGYKVIISKRERNKSFGLLSSKPKYLLPTLLILLLSSLLVNALFLIFSNQNTGEPFSRSLFWKEFFNDDKPIQVVLGDLFVFSEIDSIRGESRNVRKPEINTLAQYEAYKDSNRIQGRHFQELSYTHLINGSSEWINSLTKVFHPKKEFSIRPGSSMGAQDLHDYNIVFVGMQKTAGIFNTYFDKSAFEFDVDQPNQYVLPKEKGGQVFQPQGDAEEQHTDYGFIAKYPGPNDNTIFLFGGLWDTAASESLRNFVTASKMSKIEDYMKTELGYIPKYFEMLIEVNGVNRIGFETEVLYLNEFSNSN
ncbi:MAG: helix-turn-helix domain-containing protein [Saprospiraceae bacterium]|nr:helix-turn-helix domain-containing protein [Saprospiraceae bacterium]